MKGCNSATVNDKKNNNRQIKVTIGNSLIILRNTTKASPTPPALALYQLVLPILFAINPRAAKTPIPANNSNPEFANPLIKAVICCI